LFFGRNPASGVGLSAPIAAQFPLQSLARLPPPDDSPVCPPSLTRNDDSPDDSQPPNRHHYSFADKDAPPERLTAAFRRPLLIGKACSPLDCFADARNDGLARRLPSPPALTHLQAYSPDAPQPSRPYSLIGPLPRQTRQFPNRHHCSLLIAHYSFVHKPAPKADSQLQITSKP
jgi:hypothetical protein